MRRTAKWLALGTSALLIVGYTSRNFVVRKAIEIAVQRQTGFTLRVGAVEFGPFTGTLDVGDIALTNPPEFREEKRFVAAPLIHVKYDIFSLLRGAPHIRELTVFVDEVFIVTNHEGEKNSTKLSANMGSEKPRRKKTRYRVDTLHLRVRTVITKDYTRHRGTERKVSLNVDHTYRNITDSTSVSNLVLGVVLHQTGSVIGDFGSGMSDALKRVAR